MDDLVQLTVTNATQKWEMTVFLVDNVITEQIERKTCLAYDMGAI